MISFFLYKLMYVYKLIFYEYLILHMSLNNVTLKNETICEADTSSDRVDDVDNLIYVNVSNVVVVVVKVIISWVGG
jgi:hypothetical protein